MQAVLERKQERSSHVPFRASAPPQVENWLFVCDRCGQPIYYDEPMQVNCNGGNVEVAHLECSR